MNVTVKTVELTVTTVKLSRGLLKQFGRISYSGNAHLFGKEGIKPELVVGWIHGSVLGEEYAKFLLVKTGDGQYGLAECGMGDHKPYTQIYV